MASMRNWLNGNDPDAPVPAVPAVAAEDGHHKDKHLKEKIVDAWKENRKPGGRRVAVVHCKAGKGRSGTVACCYLITECGWTPEQALARFTERRMRPRMGAGVSIPSQLRTVAYAERWARGGDDGAGRRRYLDRAVEILEIHVWGLRNGVKLAVEGYVDQGKKIRIFHTFTKSERYIVEGDPPSAGGGGGVVGMLYDMAGYGSAANPVPEQEVLDDARGERDNADSAAVVPPNRSDTGTPSSLTSTKAKMGKRASKLISKVSRSSSRAQTPKPPTDSDAKSPSTTPADESADSSPASITSSVLSIDRERQNQASGDDGSSTPGDAEEATEPGGRAVIFKPRAPVRVPNSDVNITVERRNRAPSSMGLTMVTAVAHVWFNAYFEGRGPEQRGVPDDAGVFDIDWDKMDGIKGSSQKGTRAADRIAVVWRAVGPAADDETDADVPASGPAEQASIDPERKEQEKTDVIEETGTAQAATPEAETETETEAGAADAVPQMRPADWKGGAQVDPDAERRLGLRTKSPDSADVSQASSIRGAAGPGDTVSDLNANDDDDDDDDLRRVRSDVGLDVAAAGGDGDADADAGKSHEGGKALEAYAEKLPSPDSGGGGGGGGGGGTGKTS